MNLVKAWIRARKSRHVEDAAPQRVSLCGDTETRTERQLQNLARRSREDGARSSGEKAACGRVRLARAEADRNVDADDLRVGQLLEARLDGLDEVIYREAAVVQDDRDPAAPRAVDSRDSHREFAANDSPVRGSA